MTKNIEGTVTRTNGKCRKYVKLSLDAVSEIRKLLCTQPKLSYTKIASRYGVSVGAISLIHSNKSYPAINGDDIRSKGKKLTYMQVMEILDFLENPTGPLSDVAKKYGVATSTISNIKTGRLYASLVAKRNIDPKSRYRSEFPRNLSEQRIREIAEVLSKGELTQEEVAKKFGIYESLVSRIKKKFHPEVPKRFRCKFLSDTALKEMIAILKRGELRSKEIVEKFNCNHAAIDRVKKRFCPEAAGPRKAKPTRQKPSSR